MAPAYPFSAFASCLILVSFTHKGVADVFFLQNCILFPLWLFSQSSVAYVRKAEVLSLLVFDLLPQLLCIGGGGKNLFANTVLFSQYRIDKVLVN